MIGVIFDLNGTLLQDEFVWKKAFQIVWERTLKQKGSFSHIPGIGLEENWEKIIREKTLPFQSSHLAELTLQEYLKLLPYQGRIRRGWKRFLSFYKKHQNSLCLALATSSTSKVVRETEKIFPEVLRVFEIKVTGDMVKRKKPAPDIYLLALKYLKLPPQKVWALEDSQGGIMSAKKAGLRLIYTPNKVEAINKDLLQNVPTLHTIGKPLISILQKSLH